MDLAVDDLGDDLGFSDRELEALPAHGLDQDGELQFTATLDLPRVGSLGREHAQRDVTDEFLVEAILHHARGEESPFGTGQG